MVVGSDQGWSRGEGDGQVGITHTHTQTHCLCGWAVVDGFVEHYAACNRSPQTTHKQFVNSDPPLLPPSLPRVVSRHQLPSLVLCTCQLSCRVAVVPPPPPSPLSHTSSLFCLSALSLSLFSHSFPHSFPSHTLLTHCTFTGTSLLLNPRI